MNLPWTQARDLRAAAMQQRARRLVEQAAAVRAAALPGKDWARWCATLETP